MSMIVWVYPIVNLPDVICPRIQSEREIDVGKLAKWAIKCESSSGE
jgi:hypothetical protein